MNGYIKDVLDQPDSLRCALKGWIADGAVKTMTEVAGLGFRKIVFSGMGSSNFCSNGAQILLNNMGFTAVTASAGQLLHYESGLIDAGTLPVLVSQSGESAEVVKLLDRLPAGLPVVGITNDPDSALARRAQYTFIMNVAQEEAVSTRTYLASVMLTGMLAAAMTSALDNSFIEGMEKALDSLEQYLADFQTQYEILKDKFGSSACPVLAGRGYSLGTVRAGALFVSETAKMPCLAFDSAEFRHGPFEMIGPDLTCLLFAPDGAGYALNVALAADIAQRGGHVVLVTNRETSAAHPSIHVLQQAAMPEMFAPITEIAAAQLLAAGLAEIRGIEAGKFRWSSKVTDRE